MAGDALHHRNIRQLLGMSSKDAPSRGASSGNAQSPGARSVGMRQGNLRADATLATLNTLVSTVKRSGSETNKLLKTIAKELVAARKGEGGGAGILDFGKRMLGHVGKSAYGLLAGALTGTAEYIRRSITRGSLLPPGGMRSLADKVTAVTKDLMHATIGVVKGTWNKALSAVMRRGSTLVATLSNLVGGQALSGGAAKIFEKLAPLARLGAGGAAKLALRASGIAAAVYGLYSAVSGGTNAAEILGRKLKPGEWQGRIAAGVGNFLSSFGSDYIVRMFSTRNTSQLIDGAMSKSREWMSSLAEKVSHGFRTVLDGFLDRLPTWSGFKATSAEALESFVKLPMDMLRKAGDIVSKVDPSGAFENLREVASTLVTSVKDYAAGLLGRAKNFIRDMLGFGSGKNLDPDGIGMDRALKGLPPKAEPIPQSSPGPQNPFLGKLSEGSNNGGVMKAAFVPPDAEGSDLLTQGSPLEQLMSRAVHRGVMKALKDSGGSAGVVGSGAAVGGSSALAPGSAPAPGKHGSLPGATSPPSVAGHAGGPQNPGFGKVGGAVAGAADAVARKTIQWSAKAADMALRAMGFGGLPGVDGSHTPTPFSSGGGYPSIGNERGSPAVRPQRGALGGGRAGGGGGSFGGAAGSSGRGGGRGVGGGQSDGISEADQVGAYGGGVTGKAASGIGGAMGNVLGLPGMGGMAGSFGAGAAGGMTGGGSTEGKLDENVARYIGSIGARETGFSDKEADTDANNRVHNNSNVRRGVHNGMSEEDARAKYGDYGYFQTNQNDVDHAIRLGVSPHIARALNNGGGRGGYSVEQQTRAMDAYMQRLSPEGYAAAKRGDWDTANQHFKGKWPSLPGGASHKPANDDLADRALGGSIIPGQFDHRKDGGSGGDGSKSWAKAWSEREQQRSGTVGGGEPGAMPVPGTIGDVPRSGGSPDSREFSESNRGGRGHAGLDIPVEVGKDVKSAVDGKVVDVRHSPGGYGYLVDIEAKDGRVHRYAHLGTDHGGEESAYAQGLKVGDDVRKGQTIGYGGYSGNAGPEFPHVHNEIFKDRESYDGAKGQFSRQGMWARENPRTWYEEQEQRAAEVVAGQKKAPEVKDRTFWRGSKKTASTGSPAASATASGGEGGRPSAEPPTPSGATEGTGRSPSADNEHQGGNQGGRQEEPGDGNANTNLPNSGVEEVSDSGSGSRSPDGSGGGGWAGPGINDIGINDEAALIPSNQLDYA